MIPQALMTFLPSLGGIIFVDLILSSDNALVIGSAIVGIPQQWRRIALLLGGTLASILRIFFTACATSLLSLNYLQSIGGVLLLWVTWRLLVEPEQVEQSETSATHHQQDKTGGTFFTRIVRLYKKFGCFIASTRQLRQKHFLMAILVIVITDISTSLDNIIAVAALAHGQLIILSIGLVLSIIVLFIGSTLVALLLERLPGLIILSSLVLAWISGDLIWQDTSKWLPFVGQDKPRSRIIIYTLTFLFVGVAIIFRRKRARRPPSTTFADVDTRNKQMNEQSDSALFCIAVQKGLQFATSRYR